MNQLSVTISGSFHRHLGAIEEALNQFHMRGIEVLSPKDPRVVDSIGAFLFVASDKHRSIRLVEDAHLSAISKSSFLWLVCPDGYVGTSVSMEIGVARISGTPIYSLDLPLDEAAKEYIQQVSSINDAIELANAQAVLSTGYDNMPSILVTPSYTIEKAHQWLDEVGLKLNTPSGKDNIDISSEINKQLSDVRELISVPSMK